MVPPMFGVESEYAVSGLHGKQPMRRDDLVNRLVAAARRRLVHLPDTSSACGLFLENGARFYIDCGLHPELATPECTTPYELARYIKAGEQILEELILDVQAELQSETGGAVEIVCSRCNVDYSGASTTWGCHESFLHSVSPGSLPDQLIPHLVTRVIYTGAGGFNPLVNGLEFCIAPRLMHIQHTVSGDSTGERGIFHTKNESLSGAGYHRLHILCGESLCSETAIVLKIGATALVTAMAEEGLKPGADLRLEAPLQALRTVASDVTCKKKLKLAGGGTATAIEIQRRLLQLAKRNLAVLPPWAGAICELWQLTLDRLEGAPDAVDTVLDWAIKLRLFRERAERRDLPAERTAILNPIVQRLTSALAAAGVNSRDVSLEALRGPRGPVSDEFERADKALSAAGMAWPDLDHFLKLRDEFYQIDTRFGQIGPRGIFTELDRRGVLAHKVAGVDGIQAAMHDPPAVGRAKLRGEAIRRLSGQRRAGCSWMAVFGPDGRTLDLSDPFASAEVWTALPAPSELEDVVDFGLDGLRDDPGRLQHMLSVMRRRYARPRTRAERPPEAT